MTLILHEKWCKMNYLIQKFQRNVWHCKWVKSWSHGGLLWWLSGRESTCQYSRNQFDPWSRTNPHASEQLSCCATAIEPVFYSLQLLSPHAAMTEAWSEQSLCFTNGEGTPMRSLCTATTEQTPFPTTREKPMNSNEGPAQQKKKKKIYIYICK